MQSKGFSPGEEQIESSGMQLVDQGFVFLQDNDPKHTSKLCQRYIKNREEQHIPQLIALLVQSPDLNPIELV